MNQNKSSHLLLINPWIYDFAAYDFWAKPLGFLYLASILRKNEYNISYIDCLDSNHPAIQTAGSIKPLSRQKYGKGKFLKTKIEKPGPLKSVSRNYSRYGIPPEVFMGELEKTSSPAVILVTSTMTYWYPGVFDIITMTKKVFPQTPIILGGIYPTLCYFHAKKYSGAGFVISGDGEFELLKLVSSLTGKATIFFPDPKNLDSFPYPAFDLLNKLHYICILTSRGCPYRCCYCASHILSPSYRSRDPKAVADEIEFWYQKFGVKNFVFYDDALLFQPEKNIIPFLKEIIHRRIPCYFHTPNGIHIRSMSEEIAHLMFQGGFKTIRFGLETADENQMVKMGNKTTRGEFIQAVDFLKRAGFEENDIGVYLLVGLPWQEAGEVRESINYVKDCGGRPYLAEYSPIPGTLLWEEAIKSSSFDLVHEPLYHNNSILPCEWKKFTRNDLSQLKNLLK